MLDKDLILDGINYRKAIKVPMYGDEEVTIRPLSDREIRNIIRELRRYKVDISDAKDPFRQSMMCYLACKKGIVDDEMHKVILDADGNPVLEEDDLGEMVPVTPVDRLTGTATLEIGNAILELSGPMTEELKDFFKRGKEKT